MILILVLSAREPPYDALLAAQRRTWDSVDVNGVRTRYYLGGPLPRIADSLARAVASAWSEPWRFLFRTNASSYVDKRRLLDHALERAPSYLGVDGGGFASGSGFFLSRAAAHLLLAEIGPIPPETPSGEDDVAVGCALARAGVSVDPGARRFDYFLGVDHGSNDLAPREERIRRAYHVRCKSPSADRSLDVRAMEEVHRLKGY